MPRHRLSPTLVLLAAACTPPASPEPITIVAPSAVPASVAPAASAAPVAPAETAAASAPLAAAGPPLPRAHAKVECNPGERRFFACSAREGASARKVVLCAADLGKPSASLSLVYGDATRAEDEVRALLSTDGTLIRYARYTRPLVTYLHLEVKRGDEVWDLSDDSSSEGPKLEWSSELALRAPGKGERTVRCVARSRESIMGLEDHLKMAEPWF